MKIIRGNGYIKFLLWRGKREFSFFIWFPGGQSKPHDHSVREKTYVLWGMIFEKRRIPAAGKYLTRIYKMWSVVKVPAGTEHVVGVLKAWHFALTFNACDGPLSMNILDDFEPA